MSGVKLNTLVVIGGDDGHIELSSHINIVSVLEDVTEC